MMILKWNQFLDYKLDIYLLYGCVIYVLVNILRINEIIIQLDTVRLLEHFKFILLTITFILVEHNYEQVFYIKQLAHEN